MQGAVVRSLGVAGGPRAFGGVDDAGAVWVRACVVDGDVGQQSRRNAPEGSEEKCEGKKGKEREGR